MISTVQELLNTATITTLPSRCDSPPALVGFEAERYQGIWFDQQHTADVWYLNDSDTCGQVEYTDLDLDTGKFKVHNTSQPEDLSDRTGIRGEAYCPDTTGQCFVSFGSPYPENSNYKIASTDYETYSIVYSCYNAFKPKLWILTRDSIMSRELYGKTRAIIADLLPNYNKDFDSEMNHFQYQGEMCTYNTLPTEIFQ